MSNPNDSRGFRNKKGGSSILWVFFGIIGFLAIFFPFFGGNLRYTTGTHLSRIFTLAGTVCSTLGIIILAWGFLMLICTHSFKSLKIMFFGFFLLMLGSLFLEPGTFGVITDGKAVPKGYH